MTPFESGVLAELARVAGALEIIALAVTEPDAEPAPEGCQHPADLRVDLGSGEWQCGVRTCGYRHEPEGVAVA